ncbi:MAG TPA: hypothetical protein VH186_16260 [Chloroflexia bacterium]|nr:hypothetical protein [Chloroflexia bacterium]
MNEQDGFMQSPFEDSATINDFILLREYEPVIRYTRGELFFPMAVDPYLKQASLWLRKPNGRRQLLVAEGELDTRKLAQFKDVLKGHTLYLRLVEKPLDALSYQLWLTRPDRPIFKAVGRLARVGIFSRLLDSCFDLSLLLRGRVPGGTRAAAHVKYQQMRATDPRFLYYGKVMREGGYIILHYFFFYAMNDWRTGFYGTNDHEADWEQVFIYLSEEANKPPQPRWVAYASHDFYGDDLRRRWDDPDLHKIDNHPVVYAGAGSHASYFMPGEYLMGVEPAFLRPVKRLLNGLRHFWVERLGQGNPAQVDETYRSLLTIPFIDYARGDGFAIGPGQEQEWSPPVLLTPEMGWVENYRGLWGLDTNDPFGGERAPAGPKYNRDGTVRLAWYNALGWAGLDKVIPPALLEPALESKIDSLKEEYQSLETQIVQKREVTRSLELEVEALKQSAYFFRLKERHEKELGLAQNELLALQARQNELAELLSASQDYLLKLRSGDTGDSQAHLQHKIMPEPPVDKRARVVEIWAAISAGLLLLIVSSLLFLHPARWFTWIVAVGVIFLAIESITMGRLTRFLLNITLFLALITVVVLVKDFWWLGLILGLFGLLITMIFTNLRELSGK